MKDRNELVNKLSTEVSSLEKRIEHRKLYNIRNFVISMVLKSGIFIDYALPFILASIIVAQIYTEKENAPFIIDKIKEKASVETVDTSSGIHLENISYDFKYGDDILEHSTGWITNDNGLYERTITIYQISDKIDLTKTDKILSMSKEELENILDVIDIKTIRKNTLTPDEEIYNKDMIIIVNHIEKEDEIIVRDETILENILNSSTFILLSLLGGMFIKYTGNIFIKTYIRDKLKEYEPCFKPIRKKDLEAVKELLEVKKENLIMISDDSNTIGDSLEYPYKLRKDTKNKNGHQYVLRR